MLSFANPPTPNPLPGSFSTHDIERIYHCILTDSHCILLTGAPLENSIPTSKDQMPLCPTDVDKLLPITDGAEVPVCLIRAERSVPIGTGTFLS